MGCSCASKKLGKVMSQSNPYSLGGIPNQYGLGGWLKKNAGGIGAVAGGIGGLLIGGPAGMKIGSSLGKGAGSLVSNIGESEEEVAAKEQALELERIQKQKNLSSMPAGTKGVVPGVANPYMLALGGMVPGGNQEEGLVEYNGGGSHEQNPLGGIPIGMGANGKPNTVEHGEASYKFKNKEGKYDNYIFSNRLIV